MLVFIRWILTIECNQLMDIGTIGGASNKRIHLLFVAEIMVDIFDDATAVEPILVSKKKIGDVFIGRLCGTDNDQVFWVRHKFWVITLDEIEEPVVAITTRDDHIWMLGKETVTDLVGPAIDIILELRRNVRIVMITKVESSNVNIFTDKYPRRKVNTIVATMDNTLDVPQSSTMGIFRFGELWELVGEFFHLVGRLVLQMEMGTVHGNNIATMSVVATIKRSFFFTDA